MHKAHLIFNLNLKVKVVVILVLERGFLGLQVKWPNNLFASCNCSKEKCILRHSLIVFSQCLSYAIILFIIVQNASYAGGWQHCHKVTSWRHEFCGSPQSLLHLVIVRCTNAKKPDIFPHSISQPRSVGTPWECKTRLRNEPIVRLIYL